MNVTIAYVYPMVQARKYYPLALRFAQTYKQFPAGYGHELAVICNGRSPNTNEIEMFDGVPHSVHLHSNIGLDIGAFQMFAEVVSADILVCFGAHAHFYRDGWLKAMVEACENYGAGLYGCTCYDGPMTHVRTTAFWCPPELIRSYPSYVGSGKQSRYEFEHGKNSLTQYLHHLGFPCVMVTWKGCFEYGDWHDHTPGHMDILVRDQFIHDPNSRMDR